MYATPPPMRLPCVWCFCIPEDKTSCETPSKMAGKIEPCCFVIQESPWPAVPPSVYSLSSMCDTISDSTR